MKKPFTIGKHEFRYKKDAISYYRSVLNSYNAGDSISDDHFDDLLDLMAFGEDDFIDATEEGETMKDEDLPYISDVRIAKVQYGSRCFEVVWSDLETQYISYLLIINKPTHTPLKYFRVACRNAVQEDIRMVKQRYFDLNARKGYVKCQETSKLSKWEDLVIDHRQPNTFSVIVERFIETYHVNIESVSYVTNESNLLTFEDKELAHSFSSYTPNRHKLRFFA